MTANPLKTNRNMRVQVDQGELFLRVVQHDSSETVHRGTGSVQEGRLLSEVEYLYRCFRATSEPYVEVCAQIKQQLEILGTGDALQAKSMVTCTNATRRIQIENFC